MERLAAFAVWSRRIVTTVAHLGVSTCTCRRRRQVGRRPRRHTAVRNTARCMTVALTTGTDCQISKCVVALHSGSRRQRRRRQYGRGRRLSIAGEFAGCRGSRKGTEQLAVGRPRRSEDNADIGGGHPVLKNWTRVELEGGRTAFQSAECQSQA